MQSADGNVVIDRRYLDDEIFRRLVQSVHDYAIFMLTPEGLVATWNSGAERVKGYAPHEIVGRHFSTFYPRDAVERGWPEEELRRAVAQGRFEDEGWRLRKDGTRFWANVLITAVRGAAGELLGFSKVTRDLTERLRHEQQLRDSEENLRLLVDGVKDHAIYLLDPAGKVQAWNAGAERLLGWPAERMVGQTAAVLYSDEDRAAGKPQAELGTLRLTGFSNVRGWRVRADGEPVWAEVTTSALYHPNGNVRGYAQIVKDLSESLRVEELEAEGQHIHQFIAMLSHELRNPLAPIGNAVRILKKKAESHETLWCADLIERQLGHLTRMVEDLLDIGRITQGKIDLRTAPLELNTWAQLAVESARSVVEGFGHTLTLEVAAQPAFVDADATRLTQVLGNLLTNAAKYTPAGGHIRVSLDRSRSAAVIRVVDDGIGMSETLMQRAFDPFVQGDRTLDRAEGGLGIGLTLVKRLVDLHGGTVSVASAGLDQGSRFTVTLPLSSAPAAELAVEPAPAPAAASVPALALAPTAAAVLDSVLVVDDNRDAAESLAMLLRMEGYEVRIAHDGPQALDIALRERPRIVFLDIGLPGMDGHEVARRMRATPALQSTRLLALTGYGQPSDRQASKLAGFDGHLVKPVDIDELNRWLAA
ncbi:MAG: PAS domain S-box protein [Burkholderiales bacterium]